MARTFTYGLPDPKPIEAIIQGYVDVGLVTGIDGASVVATAGAPTTDGLLTIDDTATHLGDFFIPIPLEHVRTRESGKIVRPNSVSFSAAKTTGTVTTNFLLDVGIYQSIPTAASATQTLTTICKDSTGWVKAAGAATIVDVTATFDPDALTNSIAAVGKLFMGFTIRMPAEAMVWVIRLGRGTVTFDNIGPN